MIELNVRKPGGDGMRKISVIPCFQTGNGLKPSDGEKPKVIQIGRRKKGGEGEGRGAGSGRMERRRKTHHKQNLGFKTSQRTSKEGREESGRK